MGDSAAAGWLLRGATAIVLLGGGCCCSLGEGGRIHQFGFFVETSCNGRGGIAARRLSPFVDARINTGDDGVFLGPSAWTYAWPSPAYEADGFGEHDEAMSAIRFVFPAAIAFRHGRRTTRFGLLLYSYDLSVSGTKAGSWAFISAGAGFGASVHSQPACRGLHLGYARSHVFFASRDEGVCGVEYDSAKPLEATFTEGGTRQ